MDSLPSINLDDLMKLDSGFLGNDPLDPAVPCTFLEDLDELLPLSPKGPIDLDPIISLPGMVPQTSAFPSSDGSGQLASEEHVDPTFQLDEEDEEYEVEEEKPKRTRGGRSTTTIAKAASGARADQKERIRAKNRRAQARYREKQKAKRNQTSDVLDQATADLERLRLENDRLTARNEIMENVLVVRDLAVGILDKSREAEEKTCQPGGMYLSTISSDSKVKTRLHRLLPTAPKAPGKVGSVHKMPSTSSSCCETTDCTAPCNTTKNQPSAKRNAPTNKNTKTTTTTTSVSKDGEQIDYVYVEEEKEGDYDEDRCPLTHLTRAEMIAVKATTHEVVQARYKAYAERLLDSLKEIEDPRASSHTKSTAEESLLSVLWETGCMCFEHAVLKPTALQKLLIASVADDSGDEITKAANWAEITRSLKLSDAQREKMQPLREVFLQRAGRIAADRKKILTTLHTALPSTSSSNGSSNSSDSETNSMLRGPFNDVSAAPGTAAGTATGAGGEEESSLPSLQDVTTNWLALHEKSQALEANLMEEHLACMELVAKCFGGVLTPLQKAKAIVASYPAFPDVFAIATAASVEHNALPAPSGNVEATAAPFATPTAVAAGAGKVLVQ